MTAFSIAQSWKSRLANTPQPLFVQREPDLNYPVNQRAVSSGTLWVLALMAALFGEVLPGVIGIEEPENYVHPAALADLAEIIRDASEEIQVLLTTHSPLYLNAVDRPEAVRVIQREAGGGTPLAPTPTPEAVREALDASGFGLGEYYATRGFGA